MQIVVEKSVVVITPTIGSKHVKQCVESVRNQTYENIQHLVVADGVDIPNFELGESVDGKLVTTKAPFNTGGGGFYGHRIYAAYPHLVNADYVFFLDEDNWYEPNHVQSLIELIEHRNLDWAHSFRRICEPDGMYVVDDNCEALGKYPVFWSLDKPQKEYLVDTSTYAFKREWIIQRCADWHWGWGGDRRFFQRNHNSKYDTTALATLNYRLDDRMEAKYGTKTFFQDGNETYLREYKGKLPWKKT